MAAIVAEKYNKSITTYKTIHQSTLVKLYMKVLLIQMSGKKTIK